MESSSFVIGLDYGTDSVRALIVDAKTGKETSSAVHYYSRWKKGMYCDAAHNQFRQHPLDYLEGLENTIKEALRKAPAGTAEKIRAIAVDTTGSTPCAVTKEGVPLALIDQFKDNPNAMFILWKDHTAIGEANELNELSGKWEIDYTKFVGGIYSSEWFWAKVLHVIRADAQVREAAWSWVEHCDWIPFMLTGGKDVNDMKRSRCAAGHKAMWHEAFGGLPSEDFLTRLDPLLGGLRARLYEKTYTSDVPAGTLSQEWAQKLGLKQDVIVSVGAFDAHMGAVGGQIEPYYLSKVMGTSTCDMLVAPQNEVQGKLVRGICGQVDGSIIPGMEGLEAGQSAFGDIYAWFKNILAWPVQKLLIQSELISAEVKEKLVEEILERIIPELSAEAEKIPLEESSVLAIDWHNGRRTPDANQLLKGAVLNLNLGSNAPAIFRALVESTCFGAKKIAERFRSEGIPVKGLIALGGVAKKSPFIMQVMADVMNMPIRVAKSEQTCALGAAMFAATAAGVFSTVSEAMNTMGAGFDAEYHPIAENVRKYQALYEQYLTYGDFIEINSRKK